MRPIKIRCWDKGSQKMIQPDFITQNGFGYWDAPDGMPHDSDLVMQFTGLLDKNKKEIYDGDIVKASIYADEITSILEVDYRDGCFVIDYEDSESDFIPIGWFIGTLEVIGNIYENPELLKKE